MYLRTHGRIRIRQIVQIRKILYTGTVYIFILKKTQLSTVLVLNQSNLTFIFYMDFLTVLKLLTR